MHPSQIHPESVTEVRVYKQGGSGAHRPQAYRSSASHITLLADPAVRSQSVPKAKGGGETCGRSTVPRSAAVLASAPDFLCGKGEVHKAVIFKPNFRHLNRAPKTGPVVSSVPSHLMRGDHRWLLHLKTHLLTSCILFLKTKVVSGTIKSLPASKRVVSSLRMLKPLPDTGRNEAEGLASPLSLLPPLLQQ